MWSKAKGHIKGSMQCVSDSGWEAHSPSMWVDMAGEGRQVTGTCMHDFRLHFESGSRNPLWANASKAYKAGGIEEEVGKKRSP